MTRTLIVLLIFLTIDGFSQGDFGSTKGVLSYNQEQFDSDTCCWRLLNNRKQSLEAANLIVLYLKTGNSRNKHSLNWHAGQMFALAQSNALAKKHFKRTYSVFYRWFGNVDAKKWYYYARGTVAFIDNHKKTLDSMIRFWVSRYPPDVNYNVLVSLSNNWGKSYDEIMNKY